MIGIYKITSPTNKIYIGQSVNIKQRWKEHERCYESTRSKLQNSIKKHGFENHIFEILEECTVEQLNNRERFYQDQFDVLSENGLNLVLTTSETKSGYLSNELKQNISLKNKNPSQEIRDKISKANKSRTPEYQKRHSQIMTGRKLSEEHKQKIGKSSTGRVCTEESRKKISEAHKGKVISDEQRRKNSEAHKGKIITEEHRKKISEYWKIRRETKNLENE